MVHRAYHPKYAGLIIQGVLPTIYTQFINLKSTGHGDDCSELLMAVRLTLKPRWSSSLGPQVCVISNATRNDIVTRLCFFCSNRGYNDRRRWWICNCRCDATSSNTGERSRQTTRWWFAVFWAHLCCSILASLLFHYFVSVHVKIAEGIRSVIVPFILWWTCLCHLRQVHCD